jgi:hypothetical protein
LEKAINNVLLLFNIDVLCADLTLHCMIETNGNKQLDSEGSENDAFQVTVQSAALKY